MQVRNSDLHKERNSVREGINESKTKHFILACLVDQKIIFLLIKKNIPVVHNRNSLNVFAN